MYITDMRLLNATFQTTGIYVYVYKALRTQLSSKRTFYTHYQVTDSCLQQEWVTFKINFKVIDHLLYILNT